MLTRTAIAKALGPRLADAGLRLSRKATVRLLDETIEVIKDGLLDGEKIVLDGLGCLSLVRPTTPMGRIIDGIAPRPLLRFAPSESFLTAFTAATPHTREPRA